MTTEHFTDCGLLDLAAKAAGIKVSHFHEHYREKDGLAWAELIVGNEMKIWNPLHDDGDALRLAIKLEMYIEGFPLDGGADVHFIVHGFGQEVCERNAADYMTATRRAIVRAAAEIGNCVERFIDPEKEKAAMKIAEQMGFVAREGENFAKG